MHDEGLRGRGLEAAQPLHQFVGIGVAREAFEVADLGLTATYSPKIFTSRAPSTSLAPRVPATWKPGKTMWLRGSVPSP